MKKAIPITMLAIALIIISCEKQDEIIQDNVSLLPSLNHINFSVDDNTLNFFTISDYDSILSYLEKLPESEYPAFEEYVNIKSLRKDCDEKGIKYPVDNEYMLTLLNSDRSIVIGGYHFHYLIEEELIEVTGINEFAEFTETRIYSWDQDVCDIIFYNGSSDLKYTGTNCPGGAEGEDPHTWTATNTTIEAKIDWDNIPFFYEFKINISKTWSRPGVEIYAWVGRYHLGDNYPTFYHVKNGVCNEVHSGYTGGPDNSYKISMIKAKLDAFYCYARFTSYDYYLQPEVIYTEWGYLDCQRNDILCD